MSGSVEPVAAPTPLDQLAGAVVDALSRWPAPADARATLINVAENWTYLIEGTGWRSVLRVHRPGYHSLSAIRSELAWQKALRADDVIATPSVIAGRDGDDIQIVESPSGGAPLRLVMFAFVDGRQPSEDHDLSAPFRTLGRLAARLHAQTESWRQPAGFERLSWDTEAVFGATATWGDWRAAPNVTPAVRDCLERVERTVIERLAAYGRDRDRYGLIHADMRLANLLIDGDTVWVIDFDDCGFGWYLYDFAAAISFMEDHPQVPVLKRAWLDGYRTERALGDCHVVELDTLIMLRRLALLAWIGSHMESTEPQALAPHFARVSAELGEAYLAAH